MDINQIQTKLKSDQTVLRQARAALRKREEKFKEQCKEITDIIEEKKEEIFIAEEHIRKHNSNIRTEEIE